MRDVHALTLFRISNSVTCLRYIISRMFLGAALEPTYQSCKIKGVVSCAPIHINYQSHPEKKKKKKKRKKKKCHPSVHAASTNPPRQGTERLQVCGTVIKMLDRIKIQIQIKTQHVLLLYSAVHSLSTFLLLLTSYFLLPSTSTPIIPLCGVVSMYL